MIGGLYIKQLEILGDYSNCNFEGVIFCGLKFSKTTILPQNENLFQLVYNKSIENTVLPKGDYSRYNFNDVNIKGTEFTIDSILPVDINLFQIINSNLLWGTILPQQVINIIHLYNLSNIEVDLTKYKFKRNVLILMMAKYKNISKIILPDLSSSDM